jgi:glycosyltransferase involved in cell wall biosynthesis
MRIGLVVAGGVDASGRERVVPTLLSFIERIARQHQLTIYVLRYHARPTTYRLLGATVRDLGRPQGIRRQYSALASAVAEDGRPDLFHAYLALPAGLVAVAHARRLRVPSIVTLDSGEFVSFPAADYGLQARFRQRAAVSLVGRLATRLTVCSHYQFALAQSHGVHADIVPLGVDTQIFAPAISPEGPPWRLLHVASLNRVKDQTTLLNAFSLLVQRVPDVYLDIVGEDTLGGALQVLAARLGLGSRVTFHGFQPVDRIVEFYRHAHLLVISSLHEGACAAVLEAAASGLPTVGTAVGYVADWAPESSVAVPRGDAPALALALERTLLDAAGRHAIALRARARAVEHDADWTAREFSRLYASLAPAK